MVKNKPGSLEHRVNRSGFEQGSLGPDIRAVSKIHVDEKARSGRARIATTDWPTDRSGLLSC